MQYHKLFRGSSLWIVLGAILVMAAAPTSTAVQVPVVYGLPSENQANNLTNVSGWIDMPGYGTQPFSTTTHVHGAIPAELSLNFNMATRAAALTGFSFVPSPGSITFDNMNIHMKWSGFLAPSADASTNGLAGSLGTLEPPGPVAGSASPFAWDAYYHTNQMDSGTVHVVAHFLGDHPTDVNFADPPYNAPQRAATDPGLTFGSISLSAGSPYNVWSDAASGYHETIDYSTFAQVPFSISQAFEYDTGFAGTVTGLINLDGGQPGDSIITNSTDFSCTFNYLPGDANRDGTVNLADLNIVLSYYSRTGESWSTGDFDGNGTVNLADLNIVLSYYSRSAGEPQIGQISPGLGVSVPEPSGLAMLAALAAVWFGRFFSGWRKNNCS
jgi:hypothetical protein